MKKPFFHMTEEEARMFEAEPFFEDSILIRKVDEEAKAEDFEVTEAHWNYFSGLLEAADLYKKQADLQVGE